MPDRREEIPRLQSDDDEGEIEPTKLRDSVSLMTAKRTGKGLWLLVVGGTISVGKLVRLHDGMVIGRAADCDLVLEEDGVSRRHSRIDILAGDVCKLTDLDSSNGVRVDGTKTRAHALRDGERIRLGDAVLTMLRIDDDDDILQRNLEASLAQLRRRP